MDIELEFFWYVRCWKTSLHSKYQVLAKVTSWKQTNLRFLCFFKKHDFEMNFFLMRQVLNYNFFNASDFELEILQRLRIWKEIFSTIWVLKRNAFKISSFGSIYSAKFTFFSSFVLFQKEWFWIKIFTRCQIMNWNKDNALDFESKIFWTVRFSKKVLNSKYHVSVRFSPWKRYFLHSLWFFKRHDFE